MKVVSDWPDHSQILTKMHVWLEKSWKIKDNKKIIETQKTSQPAWL